MRIILTLFIIFIFFNANSQDTLKIKQINALVTQINSASYTIKKDTLVMDYPEFGLKMTSYLTMIVTARELLKYVNYVTSTTEENGTTQQMTTSSSFYYDNNKLIKVEEFLIEKEEKKTCDWYYYMDQPLYYTLQSDNAKERAASLLTMSKLMLKQIIK